MNPRLNIFLSMVCLLIVGCATKTRSADVLTHTDPESIATVASNANAAQRYQHGREAALRDVRKSSVRRCLYDGEASDILVGVPPHLMEQILKFPPFSMGGGCDDTSGAGNYCEGYNRTIVEKFLMKTTPK